MSDEPDPAAAPFDADRLVAEGRSLRRLACSLLDAGAADDVVHDAYVAALQRRDGVGRAGPWLSGVVAHLAARWRRSDARRSAREQRVARSEVDATADPARIAEQAETLHAIARAVHELDEPFRTAIVLRFWRDLSTHDIAARLHVPHDTVRSRLFRGLERLRARLDARPGGRAAWRGALGGFAARAPVPAAAAVLPFSLMGLLMTIKLLAGGAVAAALVLVFAWSRETPIARMEAAQAPAVTPAAAAPVEPGRPAEPEREPAPALGVSIGAASDAAERAVGTVAPWRLRVRVEDIDARPLADLVVRGWRPRSSKTQLPGKERGYSLGHDGPELFLLRTDALGRVQTTVDLDCVVVRAERELTMTTEHFAWSRNAGEDTVLILRPGVPLRGRVVRHDGSGAAGAIVTATGHGMDTSTMGAAPSPAPVRADDDGRFEVQLVRHSSYRVQATDGGALTFVAEVNTRDVPVPDIVLTFLGAITVRGVVSDADGRPVGNASVRVWRATADRRPQHNEESLWLRADAGGCFAADLQKHTRYGILASTEVQPPSEIVWIEPTVERPHADVRVVLPRFATIRGVVRNVRDEPVAGARVHASSGPVDAAAWPEPSRRERFTTGGAVTTGEDGGFELRVHPGTAWTVVVTPDPAEKSLTLRRPDVPPGSVDLVIIATDDELHGCPVTGTVATVEGTPWKEFEAKIDYVDEDVLVPYPSPRTVTFDGASFTLPREPVGRRIALTLTPPASSPFAPLRFGPFDTTRAGIHVDVRPLALASVPVRVRAASGTLRARLRVNIMRADGPHADTSGRPVDTEGRATLPRRVPGANTLSVIDDFEVIHQQDVTLVPGPNPELVVTLPEAAPDKR
ncbi:MAG TPA: sigma-70 family RNA polymerase sigma factor [Planctomycetota bacterium]|nr:sigma-70 family RNA polymerase sigma factor [Planctomycetota bacterium]